MSFSRAWRCKRCKTVIQDGQKLHCTKGPCPMEEYVEPVTDWRPTIMAILFLLAIAGLGALYVK